MSDLRRKRIANVSFGPDADGVSALAEIEAFVQAGRGISFAIWENTDEETKTAAVSRAAQADPAVLERRAANPAGGAT